MNISVEAVLIETVQLAAMANFYRTGFELSEPDTEDNGQVGFQIGDVYFGLEQVEQSSAPSRAMSLWFKVEDARVVYERLLNLGAQTKDPPKDTDDEVIASVFDPDGNVIGLLSDRDL